MIGRYRDWEVSYRCTSIQKSFLFNSEINRLSMKDKYTIELIFTINFHNLWLTVSSDNLYREESMCTIVHAMSGVNPAIEYMARQAVAVNSSDS